MSIFQRGMRSLVLLGAAALAATTALIAGRPADATALDISGAADLCAQTAHGAGFTSGDLVIAVAIGLAESRCNPTAVGTNGPTSGCPNGSHDRGLWQINDCYHPEVSVTCAFDPQCCGKAPFRISGGGSTWQPWSTYNNGAYTSWLDEAQAAVDRLAPPEPKHLLWLQRDSLSGGAASRAFVYGLAGDLPLVGDWDGNGTETPGVYRPSEANFYLKNTNTGGNADLVIHYGTAGIGQWPVVGDWDGNGTIGVFNLNTGQWLLRNSNTGGNANITTVYGTQGDLPVVGDWDGNHTTTFGVRRGNTWLLRNSNTAGTAEIAVSYGRPGDFPLVGDWNHNTTEGIGVVQGNTWLLRYSLSPGDPQITFAYGRAGDIFTSGDWTGNGTPKAGAVRTT